MGEKIRLLRVRDGISQDEFAKKLGVSQIYISYIERGLKQPSVKLLKSIADYFKVTTDSLY